MRLEIDLAHLGPYGINMDHTNIGVYLLAFPLCIGMAKLLNYLKGKKAKSVIKTVIIWSSTYIHWTQYGTMRTNSSYIETIFSNVLLEQSLKCVT